MALSIVMTPGAADANAYANVAMAVARATYRVGGLAFLGLTSDQQIQALVTTASDIDTCDLLGVRASATQAMAFPRETVEIPAAIALANIELAIAAASSFATDADILDVDTTPITALNVGPVSITYATVPTITTQSTVDPLRRFPGLVQRLLRPFCRTHTANGYGVGTVVRGS